MPGKPGSIEFRRPPGVVTLKKAQHWIAFTMSFIWMAIRFDCQRFANKFRDESTNAEKIYHPTFEDQLLSAARELGEDMRLDARLKQPDDPLKLHLTMTTRQQLEWLQKRDARYGEVNNDN
ncbi:hypothetical protein QQZ08_002487 [Neonectria magnoliae]|uniref:Uncharacterized protein n=1 Tax=Neonectria magnoliae TaxID=2732573 RepID=A0ABR1IBH5_9HYPO